MYSVTKVFEFEAAHFLRDYIGKCANLHGHTYKVEITVKGEELQENGILIDFSTLKERGKAIIDQLDHTVLNEIMVDNPTAENIARLIFGSMDIVLPTYVKIDSVKVWETSNSYAIYRED